MPCPCWPKSKGHGYLTVSYDPGAPGCRCGWRRPHRRSGATVLHQRNWQTALPNAAGGEDLVRPIHIVKHLNEAVDAAHRYLWRKLSSRQRFEFNGTPWLLQKNPWNLNEKERLSSPIRSNTPLVRAWRLKGIVSTVLGLQAALARQATSPQVKELGHAVDTGAVQESRAHCCALTWMASSFGLKILLSTGLLTE